VPLSAPLQPILRNLAFKAGSCVAWSLLPGTATLSAVCANRSGFEIDTTIPISQCVGNTDGNLACKAKCVL
jgi:hypothetical protein